MARAVVGSIVLAAMPAGCATRYQPAGLTGGCNDVRLNDTTCKVQVDGSGFTSTDRSSQIALLRAADLTLPSGCDHFLVVSGGTRSSVVGNTPIVANKVRHTVFMPDRRAPLRVPRPAVIWHDPQGACLYTKHLDRGRFLRPSPADGAVTISTAQLG